MSQLKTWCGISNSKFNLAGSWSCRGTGTLRPEPISLDLPDPIYKRKVLESLQRWSDDFLRGLRGARKRTKTRCA